MSILSRIKDFFKIPNNTKTMDDDLSDLAPYKLEPPTLTLHDIDTTVNWPFPGQQENSKPAKVRQTKPKTATPAKQKKPKAAAMTASPKSKQKPKLFVDGHGDVQEVAPAKKQPAKKKRQFDKKPKAPKTV